MNDKLKKALKFGAIALGVAAYTFLAFSVGACAARKGNETKADEIGLRSIAKAPKYVDRADEHNILDDTAYNIGRVYPSSSTTAYVEYQEYWNVSNGYIFFVMRLQEGVYLYEPDPSNVGWLSGAIGSFDAGTIMNYYHEAQDNYTEHTASIPANVTHWVAGSDARRYFYWDSYSAEHYEFCVSSSSGFLDGLYLVNSSYIPSSDFITLPAKWSPLAMFGGDIGQNGNVLTNSEMQTGYEQKIVLWGFLFRNQGVVYNRIRIILGWLGGSNSGVQVGYTDSSGNFIKGTSAQWVVREVQYVLNFSDQLNNNVDDVYCYIAGSCGVDMTDDRVTYKTGINWVNNNANVLEIIDDAYKTSHGTRYSYGGISIGSNLGDLEFLKAYNDFTSGEIGVIGADGNVFELLSSGFNAFLPILNIGIVPGVTFGLLLFMPIMVAIIIVIIKVVKK